MVSEPGSSADASASRPRRGVIVADYFFPGFRGGGVGQAVLGLVTRSTAFAWDVVTTDRDQGTDEPYAETDRWDRSPWGRVIYLAPREQRPRRFWRHIQHRRPDVVVFTSALSPRTVAALLARRLTRSRVPCVIWTQGELRPEGLAHKALRKRSYLGLARRCGLFRGVTWLAVDATEVAVASGLSSTGPAVHQPPSVPEPTLVTQSPTKETGRLHLVYASRVVPRKGLLLVLDSLAEVTGDVLFEIIGPEEDRTYADACRRRAAELPPSVDVDFRGPLAHAEVVERMARADAAVLMTEFESFGYAVFEAMANGCVPVISDGTAFSFPPGRGGFVVDRDPSALRPVLQALVDMPEDQFARRRRQCIDLAVEHWRADRHAEVLESRLLSLVAPATRDTTSSNEPDSRVNE